MKGLTGTWENPFSFQFENLNLKIKKINFNVINQKTKNMWHNINDNIVISAADPENARFKFKCPECGNEVITDEITIPVPNPLGDTAEESMVYEEEPVVCPHCQADIEIKISNNRGGVDATIDGVSPDDIFIEPM